MSWLAAGASGALVVLLLVGGSMANTSVLLVDIKVDDGPRIVAPVPLAVARAGLALAPRGARQIEAKEMAALVTDLGPLIDALRDAPDGVFVEVEGPDEQVVVSKRGDALHVSVIDGELTSVELNVPLAAVAQMHRAYDIESGTIRTGALLAALRDAPRGPLVHVVDGGTEVRVRAW